ncbi:hypothetical protein A2738_01060 [Candidatus Nomurabacteria bacterium RIFCSPHIGHO2_01_FULL_42_15]|uniref:Uncharacterized protein n=1 Tax=Candidatus Nomurabacteria bacterium RIFCSPHIGHO2_01_FULL_42_15 TaxID=1801742 RepID=A0A1F6VFW0_9BACT|nr:MAG: hypothetical protein A2738_01060 [Candidatus Nomurabacteria bacterium RIFCSPHIGHO2_01_FULL_42_15]OGI93119.1 MAG: hypothetical protein A3A99_01110 [Candidatus Nomurabacteria bacterium RIFCSPLOWO2_01_FULL_41_18]
MLVQIVSAPTGLSLVGIMHVGAVHTGKAIVCINEQQGLLEIHNGDDNDLKTLREKARITLQQVPSEKRV